MRGSSITKVFFRWTAWSDVGGFPPKKHEVFSTNVNFLKNGAQPLIPITKIHREGTLNKFNSANSECKGIEASESECEGQEARSRITDHIVISMFKKVQKKKRKKTKGEIKMAD